MKSVLFTILLQYTIFRRNFQENFFFFFYRKSELKSFSSGLCGASGFRLACSPSHVGVSCRTTPCGSALFAGPRPAPRRPLLKKGSIRKLFCGRATYFLWKGKESGMPEPLIFGGRSMDTVRRPFSDASRRTPPCTPATPFEKGVDPKTFLRTGNILFMEGQRIRNAGTVDFRRPVYGYRTPPLL